MPNGWVAVNTSQRRGGSPDVKATYLQAIRRIGFIPLVISPLDSHDETLRKLQFSVGLILIGGPDIPTEFYGGKGHPTISDQDPRKVDRDFFLISTCARLNLPILGICAGMQLLGCYFGGTMLAHIPEAGRLCHQITGRHQLQKVTDRFRDQTRIKTWWVNSRHHQCLDSPGELRVEAESIDGLIEAVSHPKYPIWGVQWHPEDMIDEPQSRNLFLAMTTAYGSRPCLRRSVQVV